MSYDFLFKFIVIGDPGVGKSSILLRYTEDKFVSDYETTIGVEIGSRTINIDKKKIKIQIWDTAGQDSFRSITRSYYRGAAGALLVYDIARASSFDSIKDWLKTAQEEVKNLEIILVGNKSDLDHRRQIAVEQGEDFAKKQELSFIETSAKENKNIQEVFDKISRRILEKIKNGEIDPSNESSGVKKGQTSTGVTFGDDFEKKKQGGCC
ncbi:rab2a member ras oncogene family [Anaeramoeba ignava]|uniref:Rab2a member ras oncogene family n=1 Tax=Anaeramoeba ignava TaxID=1746090 RepID=A0A9Q0RJE0_ANAIG|nr:rab2a member ras oncogene family [Anaeramoeba ignava]